MSELDAVWAFAVKKEKVANAVIMKIYSLLIGKVLYEKN